MRLRYLLIGFCLWFVSFFFLGEIFVQNMYEGGDEEMKKTIAKAWTDARSGKAGDSLKGL